MKAQWLTAACAIVMLAFTSLAALAQDPIDQIHGQSKKYEIQTRSEQQYRPFNEKQLQYASVPSNLNEKAPAFNQPGQWNENYDNRLQPGFLLDEQLRKANHPMPNNNERTRSFGRFSRGHSRVVTGGHAPQINITERVQDAAYVEILIGR